MAGANSPNKRRAAQDLPSVPDGRTSAPDREQVLDEPRTLPTSGAQVIVDSGVISQPHGPDRADYPRSYLDDPLQMDQYWGMDIHSSSAEVMVEDCRAAEYVGIYGTRVKVYPVSKYNLQKDEVFGEDKLKEYGEGVMEKAIFQPTPEIQIFGRFDMLNTDEVKMVFHSGTLLHTMGRLILMGDWVMTPHNGIIYEVVDAREIEYQFQMARHFLSVTGIPRLVSTERGVGDGKPAPGVTEGYLTDQPNPGVDEVMNEIEVRDESSRRRKGIFGEW